MSVGFQRSDGYLPIAAYGLIGDCRSAALVSADGSVDWLCLPRFDDPSLFGRILDARRGGHWQICPVEDFRVVQRYRDRSNILETIFSTAGGTAVITDFMPIDDAGVSDHARPHPDPRVVRIVECLTGTVTVRHQFKPAPDYAMAKSRIVADGRRLHGDTEVLHICLQSTVALTAATSRWRMRAGDAIALGLRSDHPGSCHNTSKQWTVDRSRELARSTQEYWWQWIDGCTYQGPFQVPVVRSALCLKLMTYAPTGAIIAAPTTSLPEQVGGPRNWDYRFTWLRDASFTLYAFFQVGMVDEANAFFAWLMRIGLGPRGHDVANLYTLDGEARADEHELDSLTGYRNSSPVRTGNAAIHQLQLDVYGELLDSAYLYARFGGSISRTLWRELHAIVELAIDRWQLPDASIWEPRGQSQHFTYSKMMCWVAVDRGLRLAEQFELPHDAARWTAARRDIHTAVTSRGYSQRLRSFTQVLDGDSVDAALLRMTQVRFLRDNDPRLLGTISAVADNLGSGVLVHRYDVGSADDGLPGDEGAFLLCSFWLADALAHVGRLEEAHRWFEKLMAFASPLGLYAEEADTTSGELLGNFPQAFTHLSLIGAAVNIERARHRNLGVHGLHRGPRGRARSRPRARRPAGEQPPTP
ncbi:MAG: glycoside hydrolase family 15 protein [Candidatus Dormibacteraeota bacterium]|uniref:Glycoside hydrolase family 15 protein n=1 Tax=Candidatus Amunia macphersoniae TaxID=3127014 RepID=A0A934KHI9_9BACT|nr:glycoside hydrolase family 15 protein [Candidatus Dormibacteraeota bacterium]